jgi:DNA-binding NtrC family response regulator
METSAINSGGDEIHEEAVQRAMYQRTPSTPPVARVQRRVDQPLPVTPPASDSGPSLIGTGRPFSSLQELERHVIVHAFEEAEGNLSQAARTLGLPRSTLRDRLKRFGIALAAK